MPGRIGTEVVLLAAVVQASDWSAFCLVTNDEAELLQWRMDRNLLTPEDYKEANGSESANSSVPPLYLEIKGLPEKYNEGIDEDSEDSSEEKTSIFL